MADLAVGDHVHGFIVSLLCVSPLDEILHD